MDKIMENRLPASWAWKPPMGWNSWDCFGVNVTEAEVRQNAEFMARYLKPFGWEYIVVDLGWYAPDANKDNYKHSRIPMITDEYGRLIPDPVRFPSSSNGEGFKPLADYVHQLGLKFGIHIMRGIPWIAAERNLPILGSSQGAKEVSNPADMCKWFNSMYGINMTLPGGQAYYNSLTELYASWGVDFIKADDMGSWDGEGNLTPYRTDEVEGLSKAIALSGRQMVLSISPGAAYIGHAEHLRKHAHLWRISSDFWDDWEALKRQFSRCAAWASRVTPGHWPDADMLPFGKIGIRGEVGEPRQTNFNEQELVTLMTLWCMFRSPLMFGGHLPESDPIALQLITNPEVLAVNQYSQNNAELANSDDLVIWGAAQEKDRGKYLAAFNLGDTEKTDVNLSFSLVNLAGACLVRDLWLREDMGVYSDHFSARIPAHGARLWLITPNVVQ